ncbi:MAG: chromosomal replication initiator protein DnaA [Candidatus Omnitrophota bacterium]
MNSSLPNTLWDQVCRTIKPKIGETAFEAWLRPVRPVLDAKNNLLVLEVSNDFAREWVVQHYSLILQDLIKSLAPGLHLEYRVNPELIQERKAKEETLKARRHPETKQGGAGFILNPKYTFDNFVVGPSNRFTNAACLSIAESPAKAYNPLFIYGKAGLGKTHLMQAICQRIRSSTLTTKFYYTPAEKFTNELIGAIQHRSTQAFRDKFRNVDVLLIDDIHFIANKEATQEEFFHTFNTLYDAHKQIIISSDRPPKDIQRLEERLVSRFGWGLVTDIQPPDLETRVAILKKKLENESTPIPDDVILFIAETIKTNIRELEGALIKVIAYSLLEDKNIHLDMARSVLKDLIREAAKQVSVEDILRIVAAFYQTDKETLRGKRRIPSVVVPRQVAMYLTRELTNMSLPEIGQAFGGKNHTTVLYAYKKIKQEIHRNSPIKGALEKLLLEIKQ